MATWHTWADMPDMFDSPDVDAALQSGDGGRCAAASKRYFEIVRGRIAWLEERLPHFGGDELARAHLVLAVLHDNDDLDAGDTTFKRKARYHAMKALRLGCDDARVYAVLGTALDWIVTMGCMRGKIPSIAISGPFKNSEEAARFEMTSPDNTGVELMSKPTRVRFGRRAVRMLRRAVELAPKNKAYQRWLDNAELVLHYARRKKPKKT